MIALDANACKTLLAKNKIKDNGLVASITQFNNCKKDDHDAILEAISAISQLANALRRAKEVTPVPVVAKFLGDVCTTADAKKSEVAKAKANASKLQATADKAKIAADKAQLEADKAKAAADKKQSALDEEDQAEQEKEEQLEQAQGDHKTMLLAAFRKVQTAKDQVYQYCICDTKPHPGLIIAKRITPSHKKELTKLTGGKRFHPVDTVEFRDGHFVFNMKKPVPGLVRKLQVAVAKRCGRKFPMMVGDEAAGLGEDEGADATTGVEAVGKAIGAAAEAAVGASDGPFKINGSVGQGGKNNPDDVKAVQIALNKKTKAGLVVDGKAGGKTIAAIKAFQQTLGKFRPDGLVEVGRGTARALAGNAMPGPAPEPPNPKAPPKFGKGTLDKAADSWTQLIQFLEHNIAQIVKTVKAEYSTEHPTLVKDIDTNLTKFDNMLEGLRKSGLDELLAKARDAKSAAQKTSLLRECKAKATATMGSIKAAEKMWDHIDKFPLFPVNCKKALMECLVHIVQAIGTVA